MADEDKIINVAIKYTTVGADEAAKVSSNVSTQNKNIAQEAKTAAETIEKGNTVINKSAIEVLRMQEAQKVSVKALIKEYEELQGEIVKYNRLLETAPTSELYQSRLSTAQARMAEIEDISQKRLDSQKPPTVPPSGGGGPVDDYSERARRGFEQLNRESDKFYQSLKNSGEKLSQIGNLLSVGGGLLTAGALANAQNYVNYMGKTTELSAKWLSAQERIKKANLEIGESTASVILPAVQAGADLMERVAEIAESHPWLVQGVLGAGGVMLAVGAATKVIGEITKVVADIGLLLGKAGLMQAQSAMNSLGGVGGAEYAPGGIGGGAGGLGSTLGTVTLIATSVIIGAEIGEALGNWLGKIIYGETYEKQNVGDALVTLTKIFQLPWLGLASVLDKMGPSMQGAVQWIMKMINAAQEMVGELTGASQYKSREADTAQQDMISQQMVQSYIDYQKAVAEAQANYSQQRNDIIEQSEKAIVDATRQYGEQRAAIIAATEKQIASMISSYQQQSAKADANYKANEQKAISAYNDSVAKANRDFEISQRRSAQAHQREMMRLAETHDDRMQSLAASRDALGLVKEQRSYNREKNQKEQDYQTQRQQAQEDHQLRLSDMRQAFQKQRAEAKQAYEQQKADALAALQQRIADARASEAERLAQLAAQHKANLLRIEQEEKEKLAKLDEAYKKQVDQMQTSFIDRLRALDATILGDSAAFEKYMQAQAVAFRQWLENFKAQSAGSLSGARAGAGVIGSHASGGYAVFQGDGEDGREEFVMGSQVTRAAENALGGRLSQASALSAIMAGRMAQSGAGGKSLQITVQARSLTTQEIRSEINNALDMKLADLLPAFGA